MNDKNELKLYAIKSKNGKWYKSRGRSGFGYRWVDDIADARIYNKPGPAKGIVTHWGKNYPEHETPDLVEITCTDFKVIDQSDRVKSAKAKEEIKLAAELAKRREKEIKKAQEDMALAEKRLKELKEKQNKTEAK